MTTIFFPDVAQYDLVDIQPGTVVVVARATLSDRVADSRYQLFQAEAARVGAFFVAYHWLNHGNIDAQARWCYQHVGATPLMIDAEDMPGNTGYAGPLTVADLLAFTTAYRALGGVVHLAYLPQWYWSADMQQADLTPLPAAGLHLVASNYTTYSDTGPGWAAYGHVAPEEWQYTDALPYGGGSVDFNAYRGTIADFIALATGGAMALRDDQDFDALIWRVLTFIDGAVAVEDGPTKGEPSWLVAAVKDIQTKLAALAAPVPVTITDAQVDAAVAAVMNDPAWLAELGAAFASHIHVS